MHQTNCPCYHANCACICEQTRDIAIGSTIITERPAIQQKFTASLHRYLTEIDLSEELLITDAFLFSYRPDSWYEGFLKRIFEPIIPKVKRITFVTVRDDKHFNEVLFNHLENFIAERSQNRCIVRLFESNAYHDRFWLSVGNKRGIYVGTSLTGVGAKFTFIGRLSDEDAVEAYSYLEDML